MGKKPSKAFGEPNLTSSGGERSDAAAPRSRAAPNNRERARAATAHLEAPFPAAGPTTEKCFFQHNKNFWYPYQEQAFLCAAEWRVPAVGPEAPPELCLRRRPRSQRPWGFLGGEALLCQSLVTFCWTESSRSERA